MRKILVVEDEEDILELICLNLKRQGFDPVGVGDGNRAVEVAREVLPELVILDLMLPGRDGFSVFRALRADPRLGNVPVLMLTAKGEIEDRIAGLELGADDYLTKPFSPRELVLRVHALLKRAAKVLTESTLKSGAFHLERNSLRFFLDGRPVELTATEFKLLRLLVESEGRIQEREYLLKEVWGYNDNTMTRTLDTHIKRLREKLNGYADCIQTVRGVGYLFKPRAATH